LVAVTLVPAALAIFGRALYWPRPPEPAEPHAGDEPFRGRNGLARLIAHRSAALVIGLACVAGLAFAAMQVRAAKLGVTTISGLPASAQERIPRRHRRRGGAARGVWGR